MKSARLLAVLVAIPLIVHAQRSDRLPTIGYLANGSSLDGSPGLESFREGLREHGHAEGRTVQLEVRWADQRPERLPALARALIVDAKVNLMVIPSCGRYPIEAVRQASREVPLVVAVCGDLPGFMGEVESFAKPGKNTTGLTFFAPELSAKRLGLLKELAPRLSVVAVLWNPESAGWDPYWRELNLAASATGVALRSIEVRRPGDLDAAFQEIERSGAGAILTLADPFVVWFNRSRIVEFANRRRIPAAYDFPEFALKGGLMVYGPDLLEASRRASFHAVRILQGAKPGDLPIERPTKFKLILNRDIAREIGIAFPSPMVLRADRIIEQVTKDK